MTLNILILEDSDVDEQLLLRELRKNSVDFHHKRVESAKDMENALDQCRWDIVLSDFSMPSFNAPQALNIIQKRQLDIPFIIISGTIGEDRAVTAMRSGASDFFSKGQLKLLVPAIERELREVEERRGRRTALHQLEQSEERFTTVFHASPIGIAIIRESDGVVIDANSRFTEIVGITKERLVGAPSFDLNLYFDVNQHHSILQKLQHDGYVKDAEVILHRGPKQSSHVLLFAEMIQVNDEPHILILIHDISDRKEAEEQVKQSNRLIMFLRDIAVASNEANEITQMLQRVLELVCQYASWEIGHASILSNDDTFEIEAHSTWHLANQNPSFIEFQQFTDNQKEWFNLPLIQQVISTHKKQWIEYIHHDSNFVRANLANNAGLRTAYAFPIFIQDKLMGVFEFFSSADVDDIARDVLVTTEYIGTQVGRVIERKLTRIQLLESERQYRLLAENSTDLICRHNRDGICIYASPACRSLLGYEPEEIAGRSFYEFFHPDDVTAIQKSYENILGIPDVYTVAYRVRRKDGTYIWFETTSQTIRDPKTQEIIELQTNSRDITERKHAEFELERYAKRLELLHNIDQAILSAQQPEVICQMVLERLQTITQHDGGSVCAIDLEHLQATILASTMLVPHTQKLGVQYPIENSLMLDTLSKNRVHIVSELSTLGERTRFEQALLDTGIQSYTCIPLISSNKLLGSLNFRAKEPNAFSLENLDIEREVAAQLAIAIESNRLIDVEKQRNSELTALHEASLHFTSTLDVHSILHTVLDYAILLINAVDAHIFLYDGTTLKFGAAQWDEKRQQLPKAPPRPEGLNYTVATSGKRQIIDNVHHHPKYSDVDWDGGLIGIPLKIADDVKGVMTLTYLSTTNLDEYALRLLELLADQVAIAVHNAQLYEQIQTHADELEIKVKERTAQVVAEAERTQAVFDNSSDPMVLLHKTTFIKRANPAFCAVFGLNSREIIDRDIFSILQIEQRQKFQLALQKGISHRTPKRLEVTITKTMDEKFEADVVISPITDDVNEDLEIVCSLRDITAQKRIQQELQIALDKEKELNELKTNFTSMVSHEFRTPLAVITSSSDILHTYFERLTEERRQQHLVKIRQQIKRLTRLMDEVLVLARAEETGFMFNPRYCDVKKLSETIIDDVRIGYSDDLKVDFESQGDCSNRYLDEDLYRHILQNLVSNGLKYSKDRGTVKIRLNCTEAEMTLMVKDEGIGIPAEHQKSLFTTFSRANNVGSIQGTGLGLAIVKHAVDSHSGTIQFESKEGIGTLFIVKIPNEL